MTNVPIRKLDDHGINIVPNIPIRLLYDHKFLMKFFWSRPCQKDQDHVREVKTMSEMSRPCQKRPWLAARRFFGLRACFTPRGKTRPQLFTGKKR